MKKRQRNLPRFDLDNLPLGESPAGVQGTPENKIYWATMEYSIADNYRARRARMQLAENYQHPSEETPDRFAGIGGPSTGNSDLLDDRLASYRRTVPFRPSSRLPLATQEAINAALNLLPAEVEDLIERWQENSPPLDSFPDAPQALIDYPWAIRDLFERRQETRLHPVSPAVQSRIDAGMARYGQARVGDTE